MAANVDQIKNVPQFLLYKTGETFPINLAEGSMIYVYKGLEKGKLYIYDGSGTLDGWILQNED